MCFAAEQANGAPKPPLDTPAGVFCLAEASPPGESIPIQALAASVVFHTSWICTFVAAVAQSTGSLSVRSFPP